MLVEQTYSPFGGALLIDAHSMPSSASSLGSRERDHRVDIVLGDNHGEACAPELDRAAPSTGCRARACGCCATSPMPAASRPSATAVRRSARHALQIEINRALYMDEARHERLPVAGVFERLMAGLLEEIGHQALETLLPRAAGRRIDRRPAAIRQKKGRDKHGPSLGRKRPRRAYSKQCGYRGSVCCPQRMVHLRRECKSEKEP